MRWTSWHVVMPEQKRRRLQMFGLFIRVAKHLKQLRNLHLMVAVIKGLQSPAVMRLYSLTSMLDSKTRDDFQSVRSPLLSARTLVVSLFFSCAAVHPSAQLSLLSKGSNLRKFNTTLLPPKIPYM